LKRTSGSLAISLPFSFAVPPPTYVASVFGPVNSMEEGEEKMIDASEFTPLYSYYDWSQSPYGGVKMQLDEMAQCKHE